MHGQQNIIFKIKFTGTDPLINYQRNKFHIPTNTEEVSNIMFALSAFNNYVARNSKALIRQISINYRLLSTADTVTLITEMS
jgi:hypothetical protein